jgi:hypothetical protein
VFAQESIATSMGYYVWIVDYHFVCQTGRLFDNFMNRKKYSPTQIPLVVNSLNYNSSNLPHLNYNMKTV